jgi:hypothetical protein
LRFAAEQAVDRLGGLVREAVAEAKSFRLRYEAGPGRSEVRFVSGGGEGGEEGVGGRTEVVKVRIPNKYFHVPATMVVPADGGEGAEEWESLDSLLEYFEGQV